MMILEQNYHACPHCGVAVLLPENVLDHPVHFKFNALQRISMEYRRCKASPPLDEIARSFVQNLDRTTSLVLLPWWLLMKSASYFVESNDPVFGLPGMPEPRTIEAAMVRRFIDTDALLSFRPSAGTEHAIQALFAAVVIGVWTAIETLAGDLWEAAVNHRPSLSIGIKKGVTPELLQKYGFAPVDKMGTLLRESKAVTFVRLEETRSAYTQAFCEHGHRVAGAINDPSLEALSLARNVIVHKAGRCDAEYRRRMIGFDQLPKLNLGEPFPADGALVKNLVEPAIGAGMALIESVGGWINAHPR